MDVLQWRDLRFCTADRTLFRNGVAVDLGVQESAVLRMLITAGGDVVAYETLFRELWPEKEVSSSALTFLIHKLRKTLHPDGDLVVVNVPRLGYRTGVDWVQQAEEEEPPQDDPPEPKPFSFTQPVTRLRKAAMYILRS